MMSEGEKGVYTTIYLKKGGLHIREICRLTGLALPAVIRHVNNGEREGTIVSQRRGQLKICRLNFKSAKLVPILQVIELTRFQRLPHKIRDSFNSFVEDLKEKPLITLIFGSFAKNSFTKRSDLDVFIVFQRIDEKLMKSIEHSASKISGRTMVNVQSVSLDYNEFEKEILNRENEFMRDIRENVIVMHGIDIYLKVLGRFYE